MPVFELVFVRMERQVGSLSIDAPNINAAILEGDKMAKSMRRGDMSQAPDCWEQDAKGHSVKLSECHPHS